MRTRLLLPGMILSAAFLALMLTGCGKKKETAGNTAETGVPPSLALAEAKGPVLVTLTPQQIAELKIPLQTISSEVRNFEVHAPGTVYPAPNFIGIVSAPVEGRIVSMNVQEGQAVKKGSVIIEIESLVYGNLVADYLQASAEVDLQSNQLQRMEKLTEKRISAEMDLEKTKADHARALASLNACYAKLKTLGVSDPDIDALKGSQKINPRLKIHSPISGVVDSHRVELGQAVGVNDELATVVCLDKVLVKSYLAPEDGLLVTTGDSVTISHRLVTEEPLVSRISTINPGLDENNRSVVANILVSQKNSLLKPGDNVETIINTKSPVEVITVSMDAVTYNNNDPVVFVSRGADTFEMRIIKIREIANGFAVVTTGLKAGEQVAVGQVFSLKALSRFKLISEE